MFDLDAQRRARATEWGVHDALAAYFAGEVDALDIDQRRRRNGTAFKQRVWKRLREIRAGETCRTASSPQRVGAPGAARAVGTANAHEPDRV